MRLDSWPSPGLVLGLVLLTLTISTVSHASEVRLPKGDWQQIEIAGLTVITDLKPKKAIELAERLIRLQEWLEIFAVVDPPVERDRILYLFHNHEAIEPFLPLYQGKPANMAGFTSPDIDSIVMALDVRSYEDPMTVLYHEFVHAFLFERAPQAPLWAQEGLAELHSDFSVDGDYVVVGKRIDRHVETFEKSGMLSVGRFLTLDQSNPEYNEGLRQSTFYAQAWATVHYLLTAKERRAQFKDFFQRIHEGQPIAVAIYASFGDHFPNANKDLKPYVMQHEMPYFRLKRPAKVTADDAKVHEMDPLEQHLAFGNLLLRSRGAENFDAVAHFEAALEIAPQEPHALRGLAIAAMNRDNSAEAIEFLRQAVASAKVDAGSSTLLGSLLLDEFVKDTKGVLVRTKDEVPELLADAREQFERALSVEESSPAALYGLGATLLFIGEHEKAQEELEHAAELAPWRSDTQKALVLLHIDNGDVESARNTYENGYKPLTLKHERRPLQVMLVQAEIREANRLALDGKQTQAALLLNESKRLAEGREITRILNNALSNVATSKTVDRYNEAITLLDEGEIEKGKAILEELHDQDIDASLAAEVDRLLTYLEARKSGR